MWPLNEAGSLGTRLHNHYNYDMCIPLASSQKSEKPTTWSSLGVNIDIDNLMATPPKTTATSSAPSMNQMAYTRPSTSSPSSTQSGPNYNINTASLLGPAYRQPSPVGVGMGPGMGMGLQPGMGMGPRPGMGMGYSGPGGMGMYGGGMAPSYSAGMGYGAPTMTMGVGGYGGMQSQQRPM